MKYLLDTNILSDLLRHPHTSPALARIKEVGEDAVCTSPFVACEMRYGVLKRGSDRLTAAVEALLRRMAIAEIDWPAFADRYAQARTRLEAAGTPIGTMDLLIASHALAIGAVMVTNNGREFARVDGLRVERWS